MSIAPSNPPEWKLTFPLDGEPMLKNNNFTEAATFMIEYNKTGENVKKILKYAKCLHPDVKSEFAKKFFKEDEVDAQEGVGLTVMVATGMGHLLQENEDLSHIFANIISARDCVRDFDGKKVAAGNASNTWKNLMNTLKKQYTDERIAVELELMKQILKLPNKDLEWQNKIDAEVKEANRLKDEEIDRIKAQNDANNVSRETTLKNERDQAVQAAKDEMEKKKNAEIEKLKEEFKDDTEEAAELLTEAHDKIKELQAEVADLKPENEETKQSFLASINSSADTIGWNIGEGQADKLIGLISKAGENKPLFNKVTDVNTVKFRYPQTSFFSKAGRYFGLDKNGERRTIAIFLLSGYSKEKDLGELTGEITISKFNSFYGAKAVPNHYFEEAVAAAKAIRTLILKQGSPLIPLNYFKDYNLSEMLKACSFAKSNPLTELNELPKAIFVKTDAKVFEDTNNLKDIIEKLMVAMVIKEETVSKRSIERAANFARNLGLFLTGLDRDNTARLISYICYIAERGYELNGATYTDISDLLLKELNNLVKLAIAVENNKKEIAAKKTATITTTKTTTDVNSPTYATNTSAEGKGKTGKKGKGKSWNSPANYNQNNQGSGGSSSGAGKANWWNDNGASQYQNNYLKRNGGELKTEDSPNAKERKTEEKGKGKRTKRPLTDEELKLVNASKSKLYDVGQLNDDGGKTTKVRVYDGIMKITRDGYAIPHQALKQAANDGKMKNNGLAFGLCLDYHVNGECKNAACKNTKHFKHKIPEEEVKQMSNEDFDKRVAEYLIRVGL